MHLGPFRSSLLPNVEMAPPSQRSFLESWNGPPSVPTRGFSMNNRQIISYQRNAAPSAAMSSSFGSITVRTGISTKCSRSACGHSAAHPLLSIPSYYTQTASGSVDDSIQDVLVCLLPYMVLVHLYTFSSFHLPASQHSTNFLDGDEMNEIPKMKRTNCIYPGQIPLLLTRLEALGLLFNFRFKNLDSSQNVLPAIYDAIWNHLKHHNINILPLTHTDYVSWAASPFVFLKPSSKTPDNSCILTEVDALQPLSYSSVRKLLSMTDTRVDEGGNPLMWMC
jgi:hypothetical protein